MAIYSHSRLSTFEQCPLKFKYRYIDKIIPETGISIESHLGKIVHEVLEWLHRQVKEKNIPQIDEIISNYSKKWEEKYSDDIVYVKQELSQKEYFNKGIQFLVDYYNSYHPFKENTLDVEKKIILSLGEHNLIGFIDRLVYDSKKDRYEVHDYKTANNLPTQEKIDTDRQLALYSLAIKELFGKEKDVLLVWHYLAHNKKICSKRTNQQLKELKKEIIALIEKIESTTEFPSNKSVLCNWCEYKSLCQEFNCKPTKLKQEKLDIW
ncbi:MAG: PD-(D/E)XK nuclease family protein [Nanoarchaeota archaeon]|nr:PD-(D/E)XK nuclease family protein [Nanoarchaeota archaeon]